LIEEDDDIFYHALNYRGADSKNAELFWQELLACVNRLIAAEREECARYCDVFVRNAWADFDERSREVVSRLAEEIRKRGGQ